MYVMLKVHLEAKKRKEVTKARRVVKYLRVVTIVKVEEWWGRDGGSSWLRRGYCDDQQYQVDVWQEQPTTDFLLNNSFEASLDSPLIIFLLLQSCVNKPTPSSKKT